MDITLAGQVFTIQPLNLGQIEEIADALGGGAGAPLSPGAPPRAFDRTLAIVSAALKASGKPELTPDALRQLMITPDEMKAAQDAILRHSGLIPAGEAKAPAA